MLLTLGAAGVLLLLLTCANVAGLIAARGAGRRREMGLRAALGAGRGRLLRQLLVESAVLTVIAGVAPLLGLLGTIFGMINAFQTVAISPDALGKTELLAEGIYQAMITTAAGLIVAIPVVIAHHWLAARIDGLVMEIDRVTVDFVESLNGEATPSRAARPVADGEAARTTGPAIRAAASA